jgi:hypothetical protein
VTTRAGVAALGAACVVGSTISSLILKTTPSDLDLYFWPSAESVVAGHPLLIYSAGHSAIYYNDNGPLGLIPLVPVAALANALGWAGSLTLRGALTGAVISLVILLLAYQTVRFIAAARGGVRSPLAVACALLLAPALWISVIDYGHVEQPVELCLVLLAITWSLSNRNALTGMALGAAVLTRTIAGFCVIPFLLIPLAARRSRPMGAIALGAAITIGVGLAPFLFADERVAAYSLLTYRNGLPIGGGSFWIIAQQTSWAGLVRAGDVYLGALIAIVLVALILRRNPSVATTHTGLIGLIAIASCCFPLVAKTVFPYYLLEPYVFGAIWWLARPGSALNWRAAVPALLTIDMFIVMLALLSPESAWGIFASVLASAVMGVTIALVTVDLLRSPAVAAQARPVRHEHHSQAIPAVQDAQ